jgi:hypothetical protein
MSKRSRTASITGAIGLALALIAYVPSAAAFTPAILLSFIACATSAVAFWFGAWRIVILTVYICAATFIASPIFIDIDDPALWMMAMAVIGICLSALLCWNYRSFRTRSSV